MSLASGGAAGREESKQMSRGMGGDSCRECKVGNKSRKKVQNCRGNRTVSKAAHTCPPPYHVRSQTTHTRAPLSLSQLVESRFPFLAGAQPLRIVDASTRPPAQCMH